MSFAPGPRTRRSWSRPITTGSWRLGAQRPLYPAPGRMQAPMPCTWSICRGTSPTSCARTLGHTTWRFIPAIAATMSPADLGPHLPGSTNAHGLPVRWTGHLGGETIDGQRPEVWNFLGNFKVVASMQVSSPEQVQGRAGDTLGASGSAQPQCGWLKGGGGHAEVEGRLTHFIQTIHQAMDPGFLSSC